MDGPAMLDAWGQFGVSILAGIPTGIAGYRAAPGAVLGAMQTTAGLYAARALGKNATLSVIAALAPYNDSAIAALAARLTPSGNVLRMMRGASTIFDEYGIRPGRSLNLDIPSATDGRSYITYAFRSNGKVVYVGRGSGHGTPRQVLAQRLAKGHDHFVKGFTTEIVDVQGSKLASQGAEEVFIQGFREQGAILTNVDEALSFANRQRTQRSLDKLEAYLDDLALRGLR
jgi:hypothetical protein